MHTSSTVASNLFLINKQTAACMYRILYLKHSSKRSVGAYTVIMAIAHDHAAVKSVISCRTSRNDLKLSRQEIFFLNVILFL